ncbi:hypothetical protein [Cedecea davisae]|uniref:hypothetical protein n=1 Tax=Cedecea davisae TaxID=158484 RepID=UPI001D0B309A|nr:hypothetical protein [Cedecea davisae]
MKNVSVTNCSGMAQNIAIFLSDGSNSGVYSLVWQSSSVNNESMCTFSWDENAFGLGWGNTTRPIDTGVLFTSGQAPASVAPNVAGGNNALPVQYNQAGFYSGLPYFDGQTDTNLEIITDKSFTVDDAATMNVALYMNGSPALVMRGMPNTHYQYDTSQISYYLTVTNLKSGFTLPDTNLQSARSAAIPASVSASTPKKIAFGPQGTSASYTLTNTLVFEAN